MGWSILGAGIDALAGRRDNMFNKKEADRARDWSKDMAATEMQRRVADLKLAGLNPMLAAVGGGASTPGAASAQSAAKGTDFAGAFTSAAMLKMAKEKNAAEVAAVEATTAKTIEETKQLASRTPYSSMSADAEYQILTSQMHKLASEVATARGAVETQRLQQEGIKLANDALRATNSRREAESLLWDKIGETGMKALELDEYIRSGRWIDDAGNWSNRKFDDFKRWAEKRHGDFKER